MTYTPVSLNATDDIPERSLTGLDTTSTTALVLGLIVFSFFVVLLDYVVGKIQLNKRHVMKSTNSNMEHTILENDRRASTVSQLWLPPSARLPSARPSITDSTCNILAAEERRRFPWMATASSSLLN